jgi:NADP-dependent 3-hydroxy acid dehydrogenase YdfG
MQKTILITGATSGIGEACAKLFATAGHRLIVVGRRIERLQQLATNLKNLYNTEVLPLQLDVRNRANVAHCFDNLPEAWKNIDILINNAGLAAGLASLQEGDPDDWETMIDTNIKGLLYVTKNAFPLLVHSTCPHIINIGSIAGKEVYANGNVYCATKYAVNALTQAMRIDMLREGIKVTQIAPGAAETEFSLVRFKGDAGKAAGVYDGYQPLTPADIANAVVWATEQPTHVNINDMVITPVAQASPGYLLRK